jgi:alanyl-tRNA synthetase
MIKIISYEKIRNHLRVIFLTGRQAVDDYREKNEVINKLMAKCTCHFNGLEKTFETLTDRNSELKKEAGKLQKELIPYKIEKLKKEAKQIGDITLISESFAGRDIKYLRELALNLNKMSKVVAVFSLDDILLITSSEDSGLDSSRVARIFIKKRGGRGGGNSVLAQIGGISSKDRKNYFEDLVRLVENEIEN